MAVCRDLLLEQARRLLDCLVDTLVACGAPVCRASLVPGATASYDVCCACATGEGQAWVSLQAIVANRRPGTPTPMCLWDYTATLQVGVLRCASSVNDQGQAPGAGVLDDEATKTFLDAALMREAITCCFGAALDKGDWEIGDYAAVGPEGGCVGGTTQVRVNFYDCRCSPS